jgi:hypothetical protein
MARNVVAFVGENENRILRETTISFLGVLEPYGMTGHLIDMNLPDWKSEFSAVAKEGIVMAWSAAGIGSELTTTEGKNLWDQLQVPFVSALADPPCWLPSAHRPQSPYVILGYLFDEWLDIQRRLIRAPQACGLLPTCIASNPHRDRVPWAQRQHRMVFIKTGASPTELRARWAKAPLKLRMVLEDSATEACGHGTMGLTDLLLDCLSAHGLGLNARTDVLFALMFELDYYVRVERANRMVQALRSLPVDIIGRGWDHIDRDGAKARFFPAVDAAYLPELMANTQFVVNTTPNFGSGVHERVLAGFAARACVVSDHNAYSKTNLAGVPSFFGVEWHSEDLAEHIAAIWAADRDRGPDTDNALELVETVHSPLNFMKSILELSQVISFTRDDDSSLLI